MNVSFVILTLALGVVYFVHANRIAQRIAAFFAGLRRPMDRRSLV